MRLLRLIPSLNPADGGTVEAIRQVSPLLASRGVHTTVASLDAPTAPWLAGPGFEAHGLGPGRGVYGYAPGVVTALQRLAASHDAVVIEGLWQYHTLATWWALRRLGPSAPPYWVYPHGMLDPWFRRTYPLKHLKKWLYWPWADYRVLRDARAVLFTTEQERLLARRSFWLYRAREQVAPFGITPPPAEGVSQRLAFNAAFPHLAGKPLLLSLARLHPKKGLDRLVAAFATVADRHPTLQLMLAGPNGGSQAALQQQAAALGVASRVHIPGLLQGPIKWGALRHCSLFCLPSHQENFGIAVVEALACARPVLISTGVNLAVEVEQAGAGFVQANTTAATAAALQAWFQLAPAKQAAMGEAALALFEQRFRLDRSVDGFLDILAA
ncbi:MAG: glycosyltransferase [Cyanobacteriota bacterium]|nr:glycosyltransferase [Cyanobacteriota bacterium]